MPSVPAAAALRRIGRLSRTAALKRRGVTEYELTRATRAGEIIRVRQGVYALPDTDPAVLHAAVHSGVVGCTTAAKLHGLWVLDTTEETHIWMGRGGTARDVDDACRLHWDDGLPRVGEVDFVIDGWLIIEADGRENHHDVDKRHKDLLRDARAAAQGFTTLRFDYAMIVHDWPVVEAAVVGALEARRRLAA